MTKSLSSGDNKSIKNMEVYSLVRAGSCWVCSYLFSSKMAGRLQVSSLVIWSNLSGGTAIVEVSHLSFFFQPLVHRWWTEVEVKKWSRHYCNWLTTSCNWWIGEDLTGVLEGPCRCPRAPCTGSTWAIRSRSPGRLGAEQEGSPRLLPWPGGTGGSIRRGAESRC